MKTEQYISKLQYKSERVKIWESKESKAKQQEKSRFCELCRLKKKQLWTTATDFMRFSVSRNSFSVLDYSTDCFELSFIY